MSEAAYLGLDLGTTNVKALVVSAEGRVLASGGATVALHHSPGGGVEQDIEEIWTATVSAVREAGRSAAPAQVRAVGVSSQGGALQLLDGADRPEGRVVSWLDGRGRPFGTEAVERLGREWFAERVGYGGCGVAAAQLLRLRRECPHLLTPPRRAGFVGDVIVGRLCGRRAHDATSLSICILYNPARGTADPEMLAMAGITESQLPPLLPAREAAGGLRPEAAAALGLPGGIPVSPAVHDQYAAALGAGVTEPGEVMLGAGTAWVLLAVTDRLLRPACAGALVCAHPVGGRFGQMLSMVNGGSAFRWAAELAGWQGLSADELDRRLAETPAGCAGLRFEPLLAEGGGPGCGRRGRLLGLSLAHGPGHLLRASVEGLACELARHLRALEAGGLRPRRLVMCGGAAGGRVTPQVVADATGLPVCCRAESAMSALGAAVLARGLIEPTPLNEVLARPAGGSARELRPGADAPLYAQMAGEYFDRVQSRE